MCHPNIFLNWGAFYKVLKKYFLEHSEVRSQCAHSFKGHDQTLQRSYFHSFQTIFVEIEWYSYDSWRTKYVIGWMGGDFFFFTEPHKFFNIWFFKTPRLSYSFCINSKKKNPNVLFNIFIFWRKDHLFPMVPIFPRSIRPMRILKREFLVSRFSLDGFTVERRGTLDCNMHKENDSFL